MKFNLNENNTELLLIESTKEEYNQLKLSLSKFVKNYFFMARYKLTPWDGKITFFKDNKIHFGLWYEIYNVCKEYGYPFIIDNKDQFPIDKTIEKDKIKEFAYDFYKDHKMKEDKTKAFIPYDHQIEAIYKILKYKFGLIEVATAGGKSLVFGTLVFYYLRNVNPNAKFLLIVPSIGLVTQFYNDIMEYNLGFNLENKNPCNIKIDEIMSDKPRKYFDGEPNIFIGTYQSLEKWSEEFFKQFDVVCTDECLHPDTLINTINGKKKICEIKKGEMVYTINENNGKKEIKEVDYVYKNISVHQQMYEIEMESGEKIKITGNHQVILKNRKRKRVDQLNDDDEILDFDVQNNNIIVKVCPFCNSHYHNIYMKRKINLIKCDKCNKCFSERKLLNKEIENININLNENSNKEDKKLVFNILKNNQFRFTTTKNTDDGLKNFLNRRYITIDINKDLTYKNIFDFLNDTTYEDCHCNNKNCNNETIFNGFKSLDIYPRGYHKFCSKKCYHEWFGEKQKGSGNTSHRMDPNKIQEYKKKLSESLKNRIASGEFKPNIHNSWFNTKYEITINKSIRKFRSSWEAFFNLVNPSFDYETIRIPYIHKEKKHTYIVDFDDVKNRVLYEIKPSSLENTELNKIKKEILIEWCKNNDYKFKIINEDWFRINYPAFKYLLNDQKDKLRLMKNLRYYEDKKNK